MNKYRVFGLCTLICEMDVLANSKEEAIEIANNEFGELTNYAGMGGTGHLVGVVTSDDNRCIYPDAEPEFDDAERIGGITMKLTGTYNGKPIELELTEEQVEVLERAEKKSGWERSEQSQTYYVDFADGRVSSIERFDSIDANRYEKANYFSNETLAKNIARAQTLQRKLWRRSAELCGKLDWNNANVIKWYICYDFVRKDMCIGITKRLYGFGLVYFDTKEHAEQAIEEFRDELIWYFTKFQSRMD